MPAALLLFSCVVIVPCMLAAGEYVLSTVILCLCLVLTLFVDGSF